MTKRKRGSAEFKVKVALEAIREDMRTPELAKWYSIPPTMISGRKKTAVANTASAFGGGSSAELPVSAGDVEKPHAKVRQLVVERDFSSRYLQSHSRSRRQKAVKRDPPDAGVRRECSLLLARFSLYDYPRGAIGGNLAFIKIIDRQAG